MGNLVVGPKWSLSPDSTTWGLDMVLPTLGPPWLPYTKTSFLLRLKYIAAARSEDTNMRAVLMLLKRYELVEDFSPLPHCMSPRDMDG